MTRHQDVPDPDELSEVAPIPTDSDLDETDRTLDLLATGGSPASSTPGTDLLRAAAAPGEDAELAGAGAFSAALADALDERGESATESRATPLTFTVMGRVIAAKVAIIAAVATLGIAGAGAATGAVLRAVEDGPPPTSEPVRPDDAAPDAADARSTSLRSDERTVDGEPALSVAEATARLAVCDAASTDGDATALADAAAAARTTQSEYCTEAAAALEPVRDEGSAMTPTEPAADADEPSSDTLPTGGGAINGNSPNAGGTPSADPPGGRGPSGGAGNAGGNSTGNNGTPNTNANAGGNSTGDNGTPNSNANPNSGGSKAGGNPTPNTNANAATNNAIVNNASGTNGRATTTPNPSTPGAASLGAGGIPASDAGASGNGRGRPSDPGTPTAKGTAATRGPRT